MSSGQTARLRLARGEPLDNVPRAVAEQGHEVVALEPEDSEGRVYLLTLRKA